MKDPLEYRGWKIRQATSRKNAWYAEPPVGVTVGSWNETVFFTLENAINYIDRELDYVAGPLSARNLLHKMRGMVRPLKDPERYEILMGAETHRLYQGLVQQGAGLFLLEGLPASTFKGLSVRVSNRVCGIAIVEKGLSKTATERGAKAGAKDSCRFCGGMLDYAIDGHVQKVCFRCHEIVEGIAREC